jgi:rhodanese-related sulfurtransferase
MNASALSVEDLIKLLAAPNPPILIDVRRQQTFLEAGTMMAGALRRDPAGVADWAGSLPRASRFVVYCVHGHEVSQGAASAIESRGLQAHYLAGGLEAWIVAGGALDRKPRLSSTRWVTRERPKIDRIACPWLIARFIDPGAEFHYAPPQRVLADAESLQATPYDVPDVPFTHEGDRCSFDALLRHYRLTEPALTALATIVRGADTGQLDLAPQSAGLLALSLGLSRIFRDDHEMLGHGMTVYDALHAWCQDGMDETHSWNPQALRRAATPARSVPSRP